MHIAPVLSVVTPMYNEREAIDYFVGRLRPVLDGLGVSYEVVAVDDGSVDGTADHLIELSRGWPALRVVKLRRNVGHQTALSAGLRAARGDYVVSIDADLQDPPEVIGEMLEKARVERLDVVYGVRTDRSSDTGFKRHTASLYYWLVRRMVGEWVSAHAGDFRLLSRDVVDVLVNLPEQRPVYRLVVPSLGFPSGQVEYVRAERVAGGTKYPLGRMLKLTLDSFTSFSAAPLRLATWLGAISFAVCVAFMVAALAAYASGATVPGWTSVYIAVLLIGGVQLVCVGLLGEYVGRIYAATQNRPQYLVAYDTGAQSSPPDAHIATPSDVEEATFAGQDRSAS